MSQTNYDEQKRALDGMKGNIGPDTVVSYAAEGVIGFGRFVALGTDKEKQVILPAASADILSLKSKRGVALQSHANENPRNGLEPRYLDKATVSVLTKGFVYVKVEDNIAIADDVFVSFKNGNEGLFRSDNGGGGVAQVNTNTIDTATNGLMYTTVINGVPYTVLADADATKTEIKDALVIAINLGAEPITAASTGSDEYSLTADVAGDSFTNTVDALQSIVLTTANTENDAAQLADARWIEGADADDFALLELL